MDFIDTQSKSQEWSGFKHTASSRGSKDAITTHALYLWALISSAVSPSPDTVTTSLPVAPSLHVFSQQLQEEEHVLLLQKSSNINRRTGTHWLWLLWQRLPGILELKPDWPNLFYLWSCCCRDPTSRGLNTQMPKNTGPRIGKWENLTVWT